MNAVRLIIAGPRDYDRTQVDADVAAGVAEWLALYRVDSIATVVSGRSGVVDLAGERWASHHAREVVRFAPAWGVNGRSAGPRRNAEMAQFAAERPLGGLLALRDGRQTPGTTSMIYQARKANLLVLEYEPRRHRT